MFKVLRSKCTLVKIAVYMLTIRQLRQGNNFRLTAKQGRHVESCDYESLDEE